MPTPTYTPLATVTLGSAAASVTFSSIPATYRDLVLVVQVQQNSTGIREGLIRPNNDSANVSGVYMDGSGTTVTTGTNSVIGAHYIASGPAANTPCSAITQIMDYSAIDKHKTFINRTGSSFNPVSTSVSRWASTSAITSLVYVSSQGGNFSAGSTFNLYGIAG